VGFFYYNAFNYLGIGRDTGMGIGAIPFADIVSFHSVFGAPHSLRDFASILRSIDAEYLRVQRKA
jgi:hypothetical protein